MASAAAIEIGIMVVGTAFKTYEQYNAAEAQKQALDLRAQQEKIAATQREVQRAKKLQDVLSTQTTNEAASGLSLSSPSFTAISMDSINNFAEDEKLDQLNSQFTQAAIDQQKSNINTGFISGVAGNLIDAAAFATNMRSPGGGAAAAGTGGFGAAGGGLGAKKSPIEDDDEFEGDI